MSTMNIRLKYICVCFVLVAACNENETSNSARFSIASTEVNESDGSMEIEISLDRSVSESALLYFEFEGEALLNGDFKLITTSPITIPPNSQSAMIELEILDEAIIESSEEITFSLTGSNGGIVLQEAGSEFTATIEDNDEAPESGIQ